MNPNALPAELVEKAALAVAEFTYCGHCDGSCKTCTGEARAAIAAVLPEVQARVLTEVADKLESVPDYTGTTYDQGRVDQRHMDALVLHEEATRLRAARLTDATDGTTT